MTANIKSGDTVKVIAGNHKGESAKVLKIDTRAGKAILEGIGMRDRHIRATQYRPQGGKKKIQLGIHLSNLLKTADGPVRKSTKSGKTDKKAAKADKKTAKITKIKAGKENK